MIRSTLRNMRAGKRNSSNAETMFVFTLVAIALIFAPVFLILLTTSLSRPNIPVILPLAFHLSTMTIIASSTALINANRAKSADKYKQYKYNLIATLLLACLFMALQYTGWTSLIHQYRMESSGANVIIALAIIHGMHLLAGLIILTVLVTSALRIRSGSDIYIHFLKPGNELTSRIFHQYWHFIGMIWVLIYVIVLLKIW